MGIVRHSRCFSALQSHIRQKNAEEAEEQHPFTAGDNVCGAAVDPPVGHHHKENNCRQYRQGYFREGGVAGNGQRANECHGPQYYRNVEYVAAQDITHGDGIPAGYSCRKVDDQLGSGGPERYEGQADHQ